MRDFLEDLTKDELIALVESYAKDIVAMDGVWFQAAEQSFGMDVAVEQDKLAWRRFAASEGRRLTRLLSLEEHPGLRGLEQVLRMRYSSQANGNVSISWENPGADDEALVYTVGDCRVQRARARKGMAFHPCKSVGVVEYQGIAEAVDPRIVCECLSCFPEVTDESCCCKWRFTLREK